jgi:hypothetical protein
MLFNPFNFNLITNFDIQNKLQNPQIMAFNFKYNPDVEKLQEIARSEEKLPVTPSCVYTSDNGFQIWIGSAENARDAFDRNGDNHDNMSFDAVLNVAKNDITPPINYKNVQEQLVFHSEDRESYKILQHYNEVHEFLDKCKQKKMRILVHCVQGANRSVALVVAYLIRTTNSDVRHIVKQISDVRPGVLYNYGFCEKLLKFK